MNVTFLSAWDELSQMMIAEIAFQCLSKQLQNEVNKISSSIRNEFTLPQRPFVQAALWARSKELRNAVEDKDRFVDLSTKIKKLMYEFAKEGPKDRLEQITALRLITHYIADLHQPLHAYEHYSEKALKGNDSRTIDIIFEGKQTNLHEVWETCFGYFEKKTQCPVSRGDLRFADHKASSLMWDYHQIREKGPVDIKAWMQEGYQYAQEHVYNVEQDKELSQDYYERNKLYAVQCLVTAGKRLAFVLKKILPRQKSPHTPLKKALSEKVFTHQASQEETNFFNQVHHTWWDAQGNFINRSDETKEN
jgi:hypothetical protein